MKRYVLPGAAVRLRGSRASARLLELHHENHHAADVAGANTTVDKLAEAREKNDFAARFLAYTIVVFPA